MASYTKSFEQAIDHCMLYEVGGFWNVNHPAVQQGLINTSANRKAVGYVNDPDDRGGETKFGVAKNGNPDLNITKLTWDQAKAVYYLRYWLAGKCDQLPPRLAVLHLDGCINHGVTRANIFLQQAVGVTADGIIGPITIAKIKNTPIMGLLNTVCDQREEFYRSIVRSNPSQAKYLVGWLRRISEVRAFVIKQTNTFA
ncbi:glycoside hydrolase family 108 protein [Acinetobacter sp.]|uniref:glycoside hydrolase family 108 protein n=1 Tax=Acinetobacter sp. TaxID=472 RepID=UPI00388E1D0A